MTLFVIWLLLTASYTPAHMALGFVASFGVALLNTDAGRPPGVAIRWLQLLQFLPWLFGRILISGLHLSFLILHPKLPIAPALIRYRTKLSHEPGIVLLGSSITLTPGTVTAEAQSDELIVHAIDGESLDDLQSQRLESKVADVFRIRKSAE
ncbi:MAG: Na+/H+ antiporter subunit E [Acidobacteria bacterium]|nr:Na+/H+ antiporter subunit E [Acidobacteriota bacterium]